MAQIYNPSRLGRYISSKVDSDAPPGTWMLLPHMTTEQSTLSEIQVYRKSQGATTVIRSPCGTEPVHS